VARWRSG